MEAAGITAAVIHLISINLWHFFFFLLYLPFPIFLGFSSEYAEFFGVQLFFFSWAAHKNLFLGLKIKYGWIFWPLWVYWKVKSPLNIVVWLKNWYFSKAQREQDAYE